MTPEEIREAVAAHGSVDSAARELGVPRARFRDMVRRERMAYHLPVQVVHGLDAPIRHDVATQGAVALTADWHHPLTRYDLVNRFLDQAVDLGVRNLVVAGDWFNLDSLSQFDNKQEAADLVRELELSTRAMERVGSVFDRIYFTWGNHDARFHKILSYRVAFAKAMRMLFEDLAPSVVDKITFTNLDHIWIDTPAGPWYVCHPKSYSSVPLTQARRIASKVLANVATGHSHHTAVGHDVSGRFVALELGGFFDRDQTAYLQRSTAFPNWQTGWSFLDAEGRLVVEGEGWSLGRTA